MIFNDHNQGSSPSRKSRSKVPLSLTTDDSDLGIRHDCCFSRRKITNKRDRPNRINFLSYEENEKDSFQMQDKISRQKLLW